MVIRARRIYEALTLASLAGIGLEISGSTAGKALLAALSGLLLAVFAAKLARGKFTVDLLMGIVGLITIWHGAVLEGLMVLALYGAAETLEELVEGAAKRRVRRLVESIPRKAVRLGPRGEMQSVSVEDLRPGDTIVLRKGDTVPVDVVLLERALLDLSHVTGESRPVQLDPGTLVPSGAIVLQGPVRARVAKPAHESFYQRLARLAEEALETKPSVARLLERLTPHITISVLLGYAVLYQVVGPLRGLALLLVGCPSAYILSSSYTTALAIAALARRGVLIRRARSLEAAWRARYLVLDKTGTLTRPRAKLLQASAGDRALALIAGAALASRHPIAVAIAEALGAKGVDPGELREVVGRGIVGAVEILPGPRHVCGKTVMARVGGHEALFCIEEEVLPESFELVRYAKSRGFRVIIASGDEGRSVERVARVLGVDEYYHSMKPADKARLVESLARRGITVYAGDGINDVLALAKAHVGIAVGSIDAVAKAADAVAPGGAPGVLEMLRGSSTHRTALLTGFSAATVAKAVALATGLTGAPLPIVAALGDDGSTLLGVAASTLAQLERPFLRRRASNGGGKSVWAF